jgi:hypothetical protein
VAVVADAVDLAAVVAVVVTAVAAAASATAGNTFCAMSHEGAVTARWQPLRRFCDRRSCHSKDEGDKTTWSDGWSVVPRRK